jgi:hypothetical protein
MYLAPGPPSDKWVVGESNHYLNRCRGGNQTQNRGIKRCKKAGNSFPVHFKAPSGMGADVMQYHSKLPLSHHCSRQLDASLTSRNLPSTNSFSSLITPGEPSHSTISLIPSPLPMAHHRECPYPAIDPFSFSKVYWANRLCTASATSTEPKRDAAGLRWVVRSVPAVPDALVWNRSMGVSRPEIPIVRENTVRFSVARVCSVICSFVGKRQASTIPTCQRLGVYPAFFFLDPLC